MVMVMEKLVKFYFQLGLSHREIIDCLVQLNGKVISLRSLRRILSRAKLYRRKNQSDVLDVALFLMAEMETYGQLHGYKMMHLKCTQHGLVVSQSTVRFLLHIIEPEGIMLRKRNRLRRRTYRNSGPDFMWHSRLMF